MHRLADLAVARLLAVSGDCSTLPRVLGKSSSSAPAIGALQIDIDVVLDW